MKLYKCDRCGWIGVRETFTRLDMSYRSDLETEAPMDICSECRMVLDTWLRGSQEDKEFIRPQMAARKLEDEAIASPSPRNDDMIPLDEFVEVLEQVSAPIGTFEWVLARIRQGAPAESFRRYIWSAGLHLHMDGERMDIVYYGDKMGELNAFDIMKDDWEEIPPKEESE